MNIRCRLIMQSHFFPDIPMPVGTKAITPAEPNSQNKPRECCYQERDQIPFSESWENPSEGIEKDQKGMEEKEKIIKCFIYHNSIIIKACPDLQIFLFL